MLKNVSKKMLLKELERFECFFVIYFVSKVILKSINVKKKQVISHTSAERAKRFDKYMQLNSTKYAEEIKIKKGKIKTRT